MVLDHAEQKESETSGTGKSGSTNAVGSKGPSMSSKERATERANDVKDRLVQAGSEARKRFAGTKIGQRVEQTVSQLENKFPELKNNLQAKAGERLQAFAQSATEAGDLAKNVAKAQVDQVLLNLQHKGLDLSQSNELVQKIGKSVLRRADEVREKLEGSPMAPEWLKDLKLGDKIEGLSQKLTETMGSSSNMQAEQAREEAGAHGDAAESTTTADAAVSQAAASMQPESMQESAHYSDQDSVQESAQESAHSAASESKSSMSQEETVTTSAKSGTAKTSKKTRAHAKH